MADQTCSDGPVVNVSISPAPPLFSHADDASEGRASVLVSTSEVDESTRKHPVWTSRWFDPSDGHTAASIWSPQTLDSTTASSGDLLPAMLQPMTVSLPQASQSDSATPSCLTNETYGILTATAAHEEGNAAASASPALSITADHSITLSPSLSAQQPRHKTRPIRPPHFPSADSQAPALITPVTSGTLLVAFASPTVNLASSPSSVNQSPPHSPPPRSISSTATASPFASTTIVKSANASRLLSRLTPTITFLHPYASALSSRPGNGVATHWSNSSTFSKYFNFTLAAATTLVLSPTMALSFSSDFPTVLTSGTAPAVPLVNPPIPTLSDNTILPTTTNLADFSPDSSSIFVCGGNPFKPSEYTCYDDSTLCPVRGGSRFEVCGGSCYNPGLYGCVDNALQPIVGGQLPDGSTPTHTMAVPVTQWPSSLPTPPASTSARTTSRSSSTFSTSTRSSSSSLSSSTSSSSTSASSSSSSTSTSASSSSSSSSTAAAAPSNDSSRLSTGQIAAIATTTASAFILLVFAGAFLFRRRQRKLAQPTQQYPELAYLYDPPVPGSNNPSGGPGAVGVFGVGGPGRNGGDNGGAAPGNAEAWRGATLSALGATLRGGGSSTSLINPAENPPVMHAADANGSASGSSHAALLAASSSADGGSGTPTPGSAVGGDGAVTPAASRTGRAGAVDEASPFLGVAGAAGSSRDSSRERSMERSTGSAERDQQQGGDPTWEDIDRELEARLHQRQMEETRQRRELARAFLLQAKERQEQRLPQLNREEPTSSSGDPAIAAATAAVTAGGAAITGASRSQSTSPQRQLSQREQWWQASPRNSPPPTQPSPPAAAHPVSSTPAYQPIYPPISPTYPVSGPILTSQHIEQNRIQQAQHSHHAARRAASPPQANPNTKPNAYPTFHRPRPSYPPPHWPQSHQATYNQLHGNSPAVSSSQANPAYFNQPTSYSPPHRRPQGPRSYHIPQDANAANRPRAYSQPQPPAVQNSPPRSLNQRNSPRSIPRRGSAGAVGAAAGYSTIPEEPQSLHQIMHQMNALDEEESSGDDGEAVHFLGVRRELSVRNGAVTPSSDGGSVNEGRNGGVTSGGAGGGRGREEGAYWVD